ncbi:hypothetical protein BVG19_g4556 [[Candida] boidinii]|nr:hypothetical protein BVG19_g4556 [[Candida] boidinii]OWB53301.1 transferase activity, transferring acyl groups protein [[Candida] boidinii]OWB82309.1 transferase activity, transferring acyl groups protein [[Candida] boidinii]
MASRRVVVTGLGAVTPLGVGVKQSWTKLINSESGLKTIDVLPNAHEFKDIPPKVIAPIPRGSLKDGCYDPKDHFESFEIRRLPTFIQYGMVATHEALKDANYFPEDEHSKEMTGVSIGSGFGSMDDVNSTAVNFLQHGYRKIQPLLIPKILPNMAAGHVSIKYGFKGPNHSVTTACATGTHSIGDSLLFIKQGYADVMVAGATEAVVHPLSMGGFARARSLCTDFNDEPTKASRPFDKDRNGFILGEGAGVLILEELNHALERGAKIHAEVLGYGLSADAYHITSPPEDGQGAARSMRLALKQAGLTADQIDYVNAHATSTIVGDRAENAGMKAVFAETNPNLCVSSTKGSTGHLLAAAGTVEGIFSILALQTGILPPTLNLDNLGGNEGDNPDDFVFNYLPHKSVKKDITYAMSNSFGFGGTNGSVIFGKYEP